MYNINNNYKENILLVIKEKRISELSKKILKKDYMLELKTNLENTNIKNYDLVIIDEINYIIYKNKLKELTKENTLSFTPILLITEIYKKEIEIPEFITEIVSFNLGRSVFLNRVKLLLKFRNYSIRTENKLKYLSFHDKLTGAYTRRFLDDYLDEFRNKNILPISFIVGNINSLKLINQKHGRKYGNQIIKKTADVLNNFIGLNDYLIRMDGDEFLMIFFYKKLNEINRLSDQIEEVFYNKFKSNTKISIGLGTSSYSSSTQDIEKVISQAMRNMHLNKLSKSESMKNQVISSMVNTLEAKSYETHNHAERMKKLAIKLGKSINLSKRKIDELKLIADLHDIGKVAIPEKILKKPAKLTKQEFEIIKTHPEIGYYILKSIPELDNVAKAVLSHHERWDGRGYPYGLQKNEIPILARIITIIDSYDVMMNKRAYKESYSFDYTIKELKKCAGSQFDPWLIDEFLKLISEKPKIIKRLNKINL